LIDAANTQIVTIGGVNQGNVTISGTLTANNLGIDNFQANTSNVGTLHAQSIVTDTISATTSNVATGQFVNVNVSANVTANITSAQYSIANSFLAGVTYDANGALVSANTV